MIRVNIKYFSIQMCFKYCYFILVRDINTSFSLRQNRYVSWNILNENKSQKNNSEKNSIHNPDFIARRYIESVNKMFVDYFDKFSASSPFDIVSSQPRVNFTFTIDFGHFWPITRHETLVLSGRVFIMQQWNYKGERRNYTTLT